MDPARPMAQAIALQGETIIAVGSETEISSLVGPETVTIHGHGGTLLPGFFDSHCHLFLGGSELGNLDLSKTVPGRDIGDAIRHYANENPMRAILLVQGVDYAVFVAKSPRAYLDHILSDCALAVMSGDHHTVWANTAALTACGMLNGQNTPQGSEIVMGADGLATGELREPGAFARILSLAGQDRAALGLSTGEEPDPAPSKSDRATDRGMLRAAAHHLAAQGITSAVNMDGNLYTLSLLSELHTQGDLPIRVQIAFHFKPHMDLPDLNKASAMMRDWQDDWLRGGLVKMFLDGVLDSRTAFTLHDYPGAPGVRGAPLFTSERFAQIATEADKRGLQIAVHAIGDGAVRATIDGYAAARVANGPRDSRHRIEHIELIDPADLPRLAENGIVASLQPAHVPGAMDFPMEPVASIIGKDRWADAFRCASLGAPLVFGSDWPVADVSVLRGLQAHLTRPKWRDDLADERIGLNDALAAYTIGGAWASHCEQRRGMLKPGYLADLTLLDGDIASTPHGKIDTLHVALTICGGRITYRNPNTSRKVHQ